MIVYLQRTCGYCPPCYVPPDWENPPPHPFEGFFAVQKGAAIMMTGFPSYLDQRDIERCYSAERVELRRSDTNQVLAIYDVTLDQIGDSIPKYTRNGPYYLTNVGPNFVDRDTMEMYSFYCPQNPASGMGVGPAFAGTGYDAYTSPADAPNAVYDGNGVYWEPPAGVHVYRTGKLKTPYQRADFKAHVARIMGEWNLSLGIDGMYPYNRGWRGSDFSLTRWPSGLTNAVAWYCEGGSWNNGKYRCYYGQPGEFSPVLADIHHAYHYHGRSALTPSGERTWYYHTFKLPDNAPVWEYIGLYGNILKPGEYQSTAIVPVSSQIWLKPMSNSYIRVTNTPDPGGPS